MDVRIWQSFSCNNSTSYRLVARFSDATNAATAANELRALFTAHAKELTDAMNARDFDFDSLSDATVAFGKAHGFKWKDRLFWGDGGEDLVGDEPLTAAVDKTMVIYHGYCAGGFGDDVPKYIKKLGGTVTSDGDSAQPDISVVFRLPANATKARKLRLELTKLFAQAAAGDGKRWKIKPPWVPKSKYGYYSYGMMFCDGKTFGFLTPIDPRNVAALQKYLSDNGVESPRMRLCEPGVGETFTKIATAKCDACGHTPLEYLEADGERGLEKDQLACTNCGGMFELDKVRAPNPKPPPVVKKKKEAAAKKKASPKKKKAPPKKKKSASKKK